MELMIRLLVRKKPGLAAPAFVSTANALEGLAEVGIEYTCLIARMPPSVKLFQAPFYGDLDLTPLPKHNRTPSHHLTFEEAVDVHIRLAAGEIYSRIAARYDVNQGRIADVKFGRLHPGSADEAKRRMSR